MARPETTRRRVSTLVARFEQAAQTPLVRASDPNPQPASQRPASHHGEKSWQQHDRRSFSLSALETSLEARLDKEMRRNKQLRDECEALRRRLHEDDERSANLRRQLKDEAEGRQTLQVQASGLQTKVDRLADKLAQRDEVQRAEYERRVVTIVNERNILASRVRAAEGALERAQTAEEKAEIAARQAQALRTQLLDLKTDVAAKTGGRESASDLEIFGMMSNLSHLVQNWVVNTFRRVKIDSANMRYRVEGVAALQDSGLLRQLYAEFDGSTKIFAFQATVVHLLMRVFTTSFFGLPEELQGLETAIKAMKSPTTDFNEWRALTAEFLQRGSSGLQMRIEASTKREQEELADEICAIMSVLTGTNISEAQARTLRTVVEQSVSLSRLLSCQRAVYQCMLPDINHDGCLYFDAETMEDPLIEQDEEGEYPRQVKCVTFPALLKTGDERGQSMNVRNVIMKAKVLCFQDDDDSDDMDEDD